MGPHLRCRSMRPARILLISTPIGTLGSGLGGGVELTVPTTARGLSARGHAVSVIAPAGSVADGLDLIEVAGRPPASAQHVARDAPALIQPEDLVAAMLRTAFVRSAEADIVVNYAYDWLPLYLTEFFTAAPLVHLVGMGSLGDMVDAAVVAAVERRPGCVAVHTAAQAATFPCPEQLRVVGNGIDLAHYDFVAQPGEDLAWIGRIAPEKGLEDAVAAALASGHRLQVWGINADPPYFAAVQQRYGEASFVYNGFLPTAALQVAVGQCRGLLVTPHWDEAFGNVVVEALATGVPAITYRRGGPAEIVRDGVNGFLVEPGSVEGLVAAIDRLGTIDRAACRRSAETEHSADALVDRLERWFGDYLAQRG